MPPNMCLHAMKHFLTELSNFEIAPFEMKLFNLWHNGRFALKIHHVNVCLPCSSTES